MAKKATVVVANEAAYTELMACFMAQVGVNEELQQAKDAKTGNYNSVVHAGSLCSSREEWQATDDLIQHNITTNVDGIAETLKAKPRDKITNAGQTHTIPRSITNALSVLRWAFENGQPLTYIDKKTKKKTLATFSGLRTVKSTKQAEAKATEAAEDARKLTGTDKLRYEAATMAASLAKLLGGTMPEASIQSIHAGLALIMEELAPPVAERPAKPAKASSQDVGAELSKVA